MRQKNFDGWNELKKKLETSKILQTFHEAELWWCSVGINISDEEDGKNELFERPVLILRKFNKNLFIGIPLSTKLKENKYYLNFENKNIKYSVLISHARDMSSKRLIRKVAKISRGRFRFILESYIELFSTKKA